MGVAMHNDAGKCPEEPEKLISECDPLNLCELCSTAQSDTPTSRTVCHPGLITPASNKIGATFLNAFHFRVLWEVIIFLMRSKRKT